MEDPDEQYVLPAPTGCEGCGSSLIEVPVSVVRRRQVFDLAVPPPHASRVVADLNAHARARGLHEGSRSAQLPGLQRAIAYLKAKQPYLDYDLALTLGWPIATGVIEGCCRYLIKDRLDVTGARWSLTGAEAVLLLRAVIDNGDSDVYWEYHGRLEHERQHAARYQQDFVVAA